MDYMAQALLHLRAAYLSNMQIYDDAGELPPLYTIMQERAIGDILTAAALLGQDVSDWVEEYTVMRAVRRAMLTERGLRHGL